MGREDGGVEEVGEEEMKQGEHSPQHLPGKPGELLLVRAWDFTIAAGPR